MVRPARHADSADIASIKSGLLRCANCGSAKSERGNKRFAKQESPPGNSKTKRGNMSDQVESRRRVRLLFDRLELTDEQADMIQDLFKRELIDKVRDVQQVEMYEGRLEFGGFGVNFLPDAETEMGDVPSVDRWLDDAIRDPGEYGPYAIRVRLTVEVVGETKTVEQETWER
jgi:hypothetical protein